MNTKAPGKSHRTGISLIELTEMFPTEQAAVDWFEAIYWPEIRCCGHCGSIKTREVPSRKPMPYWCTDCRSYFSVRTGTTLQSSRLPLRKWSFAVYLYVTNLKSISSMKLHRELNVTQKTAWFMMHRLREAWSASGLEKFAGPVEDDETYMGGKRQNMSKAKRAELSGRGTAGKTAVVGAKDRSSNKVSAKVITATDTDTLQGFVSDNSAPDAIVYTDEASAYQGLPFTHEAVKHSAGDYVNGMAQTNGIESFWSTLKRAHKGTFHKLSPKHLNRYVQEFAGKHNIREADIASQMHTTVAGLVGRSLCYKDLIAENGLDSMARG